MDGRLLAHGCDVEALPADRMMHVMAYVMIDDNILEQEYRQKRDEARAAILRLYSGNYEGAYGSNDDSSDPMGREPLPYIEPTEETEDGFAGLDAPLGG